MVADGAGSPEPWVIDTWQQAELNAARWLRHWGFRGVNCNPGGADGGIDVHSVDGYAQVKWRASVTGRPDLQKLLGAGARLDGTAVFFTMVGYSAQAMSFADEHGIALFTYDLATGTPTPCNRAADLVFESRRSPEEIAQYDEEVAARMVASILAMEEEEQRRKRAQWEEENRGFAVGMTVLVVIVGFFPSLFLFSLWHVDAPGWWWWIRLAVTIGWAGFLAMMLAAPFLPTE